MNRGAGAGLGAFHPLGVEAGRRLLEALDEGSGDAAAVGYPGRRRGDGHRRRVAVAAFSISIGFLLPIAAPVRFITASPGDERSPEMKKHAFAAVTASVGVAIGAVSAGALAQDAVQWRVEDGGNGHWYRVASLPDAPYGEKVAFAAALSAQLASIESPSENDFVRSVGVGAGIPCRLVVGGSRSCSSCVWTWNDGASWRYENWGSSEPNTPGQAHVEMFIGFGAVGQWADVADSDGSCSTFLLEWSADCNADGIVDYGQILAGELPDANGNNIPDCCEEQLECPEVIPAVQWKVEEGGNGHWYALHIAPLLSFDQFASDCLLRGGYMASLTSAAEHGVVIALMKQQQWLSISGWPAIGLYRTDGGSPWQWLTGEPVNYQPWALGEPSLDGVFAQLWGTGTTPNLTWVANGNSTVSSAVIEWSADCNADGIVDYGQILAGELPDANGNNIPDCCEGGVACDPCAAADLIANGQIDGVDLALLISAWGTDGGEFPQADIDRDGTVTGSDLALLLSYWGPCD